MPFSNSSLLTLEQAHQLLKRFDCLKPTSDITPAERDALQQALHRVASHSDYQILGICAETLAQAVQALETYATALGYDVVPNLPAIDGAVYVKFNPKAGSCYTDSYAGAYRGVLVSCQSADEGINEMYGHLPLDLFVAV